jgi:hypothetical protein
MVLLKSEMRGGPMKLDTVGAIEMEARRIVEHARAAGAPIEPTEVARRTLAAFPAVAIEFLAVLEEYARSVLDECRKDVCT